MVEYLEIFKGDDTNFSLNQAICIKLITDYDLTGCTAHVKFYDYEQTFYPIVDKKLPLVFPSSATSKFPLGRGSAKIWLTDTNGYVRTVANDLKILVTNNVDLLDRNDMTYSLIVKYDYNDLDGKPKLNGKIIEGDHDAAYYELVGFTVDSELSETSVNPVQNKVLTEKFTSVAEVIASHISDKENPHSVTKKQVGLENCDNTSDSDKPVSTAQQEAINSVAESASEAISAEKERAEGAESGLSESIGTLSEKVDDDKEELSGKIKTNADAITEINKKIVPVKPSSSASSDSLAGAKATAEYIDDVVDDKQDQIWVDDASGVWIIDTDISQISISEPTFNYIKDTRSGKTGKVWVANGNYLGSLQTWYGPESQTAVTGQFVNLNTSIASFYASRIVKIPARADNDYSETVNKMRLATVTTVNGAKTDTEKKIQETDKKIQDLANKFDFTSETFTELTEDDSTAKIKTVINAMLRVLKDIK